MTFCDRRSSMSVRSSDGWERRILADVRVELDHDRTIRGTAIVFDALSQDLGGFREIIKPEAIDRTLREGLDVRALVDHDTGKVLGRTKSGTLLLRKTRRGLEVSIDAPNTSYARDLLESVERGDISGMSFGFRTLTDDWRMEDGETIREVTDMIVSEVSVVAFPAYTQTDASVAQRSLQQFREAQQGRSLEMAKRWLKTTRAR